MRSLDKCPKCEGYMLTRSTRGTKGGNRIRYLKCSTCDCTGKERIVGAARPRPKEGYRLEHTSARKAGIRLARGKIVGTIKVSPDAAALGGKDTTMLLSIFQVTEKVGLGLDWQTTRDWIEGGVMPSPIIVGGFLRWPQSQLDVWVEQGCPQSAALSERDCDPLWDALLAELKALDETRKENVR